jgi:hypothetical protein
MRECIITIRPDITEDISINCKGVTNAELFVALKWCLEKVGNRIIDDAGELGITGNQEIAEYIEFLIKNKL